MSETRFLLDTDIVSLSGRQRPPPGLREWMMEVGIKNLAICFPVIAELRRGACLLRNRNPEKAASIEIWIEEILKTDFVMPEMSPEVAQTYAMMTSVPSLKSMWSPDRQSKSQRLGHDLMVASIAIAHGMPIITANVRDFMRIDRLFPLPGVYHPLESRWHVRPAPGVTIPILFEDARVLRRGSICAIPREEGSFSTRNQTLWNRNVQVARCRNLPVSQLYTTPGGNRIAIPDFADDLTWERLG